MHRYLNLALWTSLAAIGAGTVPFACSSDEASPPATNFEQCGHGTCEDGSPTKDVIADKVLSEAYDGPSFDMKGFLYWMEAPMFRAATTLDQAEQKKVQYAAKVRVTNDSYDNSVTYEPATGFELTNIPDVPLAFLADNVAESVDAGTTDADAADGGDTDADEADGDSADASVADADEADVSVADADAGSSTGANGLIPTLWRLENLNQDTYPVGVIRRSEFDNILASVTPPLTFNPQKASVLVVITNMLSDVIVLPPNQREAILYYVDDKWQRDVPTGTGGDGLAIIVNMDAEPYPGSWKYISYKKGESTVDKTDKNVPIAQGALTIAYQTLGF